MGFRRQLHLGQVAHLAVVSGISIAAVAIIDHTHDEATGVVYRFTDLSRSTHQLRFEAEHLVASNRAYLLTADDRYLSHIDLATRAFQRTLLELRAVASEDAVLDDVERTAGAYRASAQRARTARHASLDLGPALQLFETDTRATHAALQRSLDALLDAEHALLEMTLGRSTEIARAAEITIAAMAALAIVLAVLLDSVFRRRMSEEFARTQAANARTQRAVEARDELLSVVAHDLRTPLNAILLAGTALSERDDLAGWDRPLRAIVNAAQRMEHLVNDLVDLSHLDRGSIALESEDFDAASAIEAAASLFHDQAAARSAEIRVEPTSAVVLADRERIIRVLTNLLGNAVRMIPRGGHVRIGAAQSGVRVRFEITDDGPGISEDDQARLFDRHWQGRERRGGLGLGLFICRRLVEAHGGTIGVRSKPGQGTTFWFELASGQAVISRLAPPAST